MAGEANGQTPRPPDDEYKKATKEVVDDMLREDVLGPRICAILTNHTPASEKVKHIIADAITKEPTIKQAIEVVIGELDSKRKSRWIDRTVGAAGGLLLTVLGGIAVYYITHLPKSSPVTTTGSGTQVTQQTTKSQ